MRIQLAADVDFTTTGIVGPFGGFTLLAVVATRMLAQLLRHIAEGGTRRAWGIRNDVGSRRPGNADGKGGSPRRIRLDAIDRVDVPDALLLRVGGCALAALTGHPA